jgi:hypothetical protein
MNTTTLIALQPEGRVKEEMQSLRRLLLAFAEQRATVEEMIEARRVCGLPEYPPITQAFAEMRAMYGHHVDGVDVDVFMADVRGDDLESLQNALDAAHEECNTLRADLAAALTQLAAERQKTADLAAIVRDAGRQISRLLDICDALERRALDQVQEQDNGA